MIIRINGGLGNQMFQYACYLCLKKNNKSIKLDISLDNPFKYQLEIFPSIKIDKTHYIVSFLLANGVVRKILKILGIYGVQDDDISREYRYHLVNEGYFQDERFFSDIKTQILNDFRFPKGEKKLKDIEKYINAHDCSVSLHVRRGDYLKLNDIYGNICTDQYYESAISCFDEKSLFVIFSNDIDWVKNNLRITNALFISRDLFDEYADWYDMYLMSICKNNITANSTFSWWGAYLNNNPSKIVVCPTKWTNKSSRKFKVDNWVEIDNKGVKQGDF